MPILGCSWYQGYRTDFSLVLCFSSHWPPCLNTSQIYCLNNLPLSSSIMPLSFRLRSGSQFLTEARTGSALPMSSPSPVPVSPRAAGLQPLPARPLPQRQPASSLCLWAHGNAHQFLVSLSVLCAFMSFLLSKIEKKKKGIF